MSKSLQTRWKRFWWTIQRADVSSFSGLRKGSLLGVRFLLLTIKGIFNKRLMTEAAALTYSTMFSIVPLGALVLCFASGFGLEKVIENYITQNVDANEAEVNNYLLQFVHSYLDNANNSIVIGVGIIVLLYSVVRLFNAIENAFNSIWQVEEKRNWMQKIRDYMAIALILPLLMILSIGIGIHTDHLVASLHGHPLTTTLIWILVRLAPFLIVWIMFSLLYIMVPNTKVNRRHAVIAAAFTSLMYLLAQYVFVTFQTKITSYNAVYGSFSAIPFMLMLTHVSWSICLIGAEMTYDSQSLNDFVFHSKTKKHSMRYNDFSTLLVMHTIMLYFQKGLCCSPEIIASKTSLSLRRVKKGINRLLASGLVHEINDDKDSTHYQPAMDSSQLTDSYILWKLYVSGKGATPKEKENFRKEWESVCKITNFAE